MGVAASALTVSAGKSALFLPFVIVFLIVLDMATPVMMMLQTVAIACAMATSLALIVQ